MHPLKDQYCVSDSRAVLRQSYMDGMFKLTSPGPPPAFQMRLFRVGLPRLCVPRLQAMLWLLMLVVECRGGGWGGWQGENNI